MARLPLDPRISRMLIEARRENALGELMIIGAALSIQDPRERPLDQEAAGRAGAGCFSRPALRFCVSFKNLAGLLAGTGHYRNHARSDAPEHHDLP